MAYNWTTEWPGVYARHSSDCPLRRGEDCTCGRVDYRATVKGHDGNSPEFGSAVEARDWLRDQRASVAASTEAPAGASVMSTVVREFLAAAAADDRPGRDMRELCGDMSYVNLEMGGAQIHDVRRGDVQALIDRLEGAGVPDDRVRAVAEALGELFIYAVRRDLVDFTPIIELTLPEAPELLGPMSDPMPEYAPALTAMSDAPGAWTPGAFEPDDEPFEDEPVYGVPGRPLDDQPRPTDW